MNLTIAELNELVYCLGRVIAEDKNGYNNELRQQVFDKLYSELEHMIKEEEVHIMEDEAREREILAGEWDEE